MIGRPRPRLYTLPCPPRRPPFPQDLVSAPMQQQQEEERVPLSPLPHPAISLSAGAAAQAAEIIRRRGRLRGQEEGPLQAGLCLPVAPDASATTAAETALVRSCSAPVIVIRQRLPLRFRRERPPQEASLEGAGLGLALALGCLHRRRAASSRARSSIKGVYGSQGWA